MKKYSKIIIASILLVGFTTLLVCCKSNNQYVDKTIDKIVAVLDKNTNNGLFPNYNPYYAPQDTTNTFRLSQDYPTELPKQENQPWLEVDFEKDWEKYMDVVLKYCFEGNIEVDFQGQDNKVRKWYHTPWQHNDFVFNKKGIYVGAGREYHHGLTRERTSDPGSIYRD